MFKVGIENIDGYKHLFLEKQVGLITNPTGVNRHLKSTIDILNEKTNLTALFSPEHGIRGDLQAGVKLDDYVDPDTGVIVYSLYGKNRKPTEEMLENVDVLCFDIQDVGARFYTFVYTMAYSMMACAEQGKKFVVFDRPNPVGGTVEGNILDTTFRSFIGYFPIVQRHGLTVGELAMLFNTEFGINCDLEVIKMTDYNHDIPFEELNFPWVYPSVNIPFLDTAYVYLATCIFEGTNVSEGRGTAKPFHLVGAPWLKSEETIKRLNEEKLDGVLFRKAYFTPTLYTIPKYTKYGQEFCSGIEVIITDYQTFKPVLTGFTMLYIIRELHPEFAFNPPFAPGQHQMIDLNVGSDFVRKNTKTLDEVKVLLERDSIEFRITKERYHLYD